MSHEALIEDLRQKSIERIKQIRIEAEAKAEELRIAKDEEFERKKAEVIGQLKSEADKVAAPILHEAECQALAIEDEALRRLSKRLYALAIEMLSEMLQNDHKSIFSELVKEIPPGEWRWVRVNPQDVELARHYFPACEVSDDPSIIGGFVAGTEDEKWQVVNTLQRRLEKGWPLILTKVLQDIIEGDDAASTA